ncbi:MAG: hypothetical protein NUW09_07495, partial [Deltaproteobacteria bacterium]|nr:hypothetical protein [Deltaproteobacteria bacterium]
MTGAAQAVDFPILSILVFLPAVGATLMLLLLKKEWVDAGKWCALGISLAVFFLSLYLPFTFDSGNPGLQWVEKAVWIKRLGVSYYLGV